MSIEIQPEQSVWYANEAWTVTEVNDGTALLRRYEETFDDAYLVTCEAPVEELEVL